MGHLDKMTTKAHEIEDSYVLKDGVQHSTSAALPPPPGTPDTMASGGILPSSQQDRGPDMPLPSYPPPPPMQQQQQQRPRHWIIYDWITEIAMMAVGLMSLAGIYDVLTKYNNSPLPKFPYSVTLNTIVSLLTQVFTTAVGTATGTLIGQCKWNWFSPTRSGDYKLQRLSDYVVFDEAAQGPMGAAKLLLTRPVMILGSGASLGALLVLTMPIVGSFAQQLVKYEARSLPFANATYNQAGGVPSVPASALYNAYMTGSILAEKTTALAWKGGFNNVVYNVGTTTDFAITPSCLTGNCTWPDYATLGVSSVCINRTSDINMSCEDEGLICDYSMKYGSGPTGNFSNRYGTYINGSLDTDASGDAAIFNETSAYGNEISRVTYLFTEEGGTPKAVTCSLYLAVHTRRTAVVNGILLDTIISTFPNGSVANAHDKIKTVQLDTSDYTNISMTPSTEDGGVFAPGPDGPKRFSILNFSWSTMTYYAQSALIAYAGGGVNEVSYSNDLSRVLYNLDLGMTLNNKTLTLAGDKGASVGYFYQKLADSLTVVLRSDQASTGTKLHNGTAYMTQTYVKSDWKWLALPGVVLFLASCLLAFVMWQTSHHGVDTFKGGALPGLFINVAAPAQPVAAPTHPDSTAAMSGLADQIHVRLSRGGDGRLIFTS